MRRICCNLFFIKATNIIIFLFLLFNFVNLHAQKTGNVIKGKVIAANGSPAANVNIILEKSNKTTVTDDKGFFIFQHVAPTSDTLIIASIESKLLSRNIIISDGETLDLGTLNLEYNVHQLETVEIRGRLSKSYKSDYSFFGNKTETPVINIPQSISAVTKELIEDKMEFTVKDAVSEVAGVNQYSGYEEYAIRGFKAENAVTINGLRSYNTTFASSLLVNVERIEVIKGPTATLYGNCDPGGTINLVTKKPLETNEAEINLYAGKWNHYRATGDVTGPVNKSKTLLYRFNAGYDDTKSFRNNVTAKSYDIAPSFSFIPNDKFKINIDFSVSHINTVLDRGQPGYNNNTLLQATPANLSLIQKSDYLHQTSIASNVALSYQLNKRLSFNSGYLNYYTNQNVAEHGLYNYITPDSVYLYYTKWNYPTHTHTFTNYFTYKANTGKLNHELLSGYDLIKSETELAQKFYELPDEFGEGSGIAGTFSLKNPSYNLSQVNAYKTSTYNEDGADVDAEAYRTQGIYLQDQVSINKWKFLFSVREEFYKAGDDDDDVEDSTGGDDDDDAIKVFLPRVGILYSVKPNISLYATYNKGFDPFEASVTTQVFEEPFKPVTSQLIEAGAKANFFRNNLAASVAFYQIILHNVAVNANNISNPNLFTQQGKNRSRGFEMEASGNILPNLNIYLTYAYSVCKIIKSKIASQVGMLAENAPRNTSSSYIKYIFDKGFFKGFGLSAGHLFVGRRNTLDAAIQLPQYILLNAGLQYNYHNFKIAALIDNITNKKYWTGGYNNIYKWPGQPTNLMVNLSYRL